MIQSRRRLPHWVPDGVPVFVTWRLGGTLPCGFATYGEQHRHAGVRFAAADGELDRATSGPLWLRERRVAGMVSDALQYGASAKS